MSQDIVLFDVEPRGVARVTLNRPEVHNAFNAEVIERLGAIWDEIAGRRDIRVVLIKGNGKSFSAGGDLDWMRKSGQQDRAANLAETIVLAGMLKKLNELPQATVTLVHGNCMAGGTGLAATSDIVIASVETKFALTEVRLGLTPATISPYVVAAIGPRQARRYFLTAERFEAPDAHRIGLVHELAKDAEELAAKGEAMVQALLLGAPEAIAESKKLVRNVAHVTSPDEALMRYTAENIADRRASAEGQEGLAAFFAKRKPNWVG
ncbi:enoyl-CoA hydratase-related protein [Ferrovibrio sp.]|uniref:enoyl-CoA hydratase-related protein n=1 Tax=Ferrovibrio sp. TaxID=1917215 RepID=UPI0025BFC9D5|nr:enoyl-CoA hydratase-related protein [Ferrovibrio sp.]MBX3454074.1 enoyl-CoA hydratase/isomerase family protein [Ferrovibrio sp.]